MKARCGGPTSSREGSARALVEDEVDAMEWTALEDWKPTNTCMSYIHAAKAPVHFAPPREIFQTILAFHQALISLASSILKNYGLVWPNVLSAGI